MKAILKSRGEIAQGTLKADFELGKSISFRPGQYFYITLIKPRYTDSKGESRHFTIVNSPNEKNIISMATRLTGSAFKKSLAELPLGSEVEIEAVTGDFVLPKDAKQQLVFIAGGIGITPFISMLRYVNEEKLGYKITLIYSNRDEKSSAFLDELKACKSLKLVLTMTQDSSWRGESRRIDAQLIKEYVPGYLDALFYIAGPPVMVGAVVGSLKELKVKNIKAENFVGY